MLDIVIIGSGPCGLFAGFYAGMNGLKGKIIESLPYYGGQLTTVYPQKHIYDIPGILKITAKDYIERIYQQYAQFKDDIKIDFNTSFNYIKRVDDHLIVETNNGTYETKTVLITTGNGDFIARKLDIEGASEFKNIIYSIQDITKYKDKKMLVLGGGDSAIDWAMLLTSISDKVSVIHRRNEFRAHDASVDSLRKAKATILTPYKVEQLLGSDNKVDTVIIRNLEDDKTLAIDCDAILVSYGFLPSKINFNDFGINAGATGILVKENMSTSLEGVYAAGNSVYYPGKIKTIATGNGEVVTAIQAIINYLHPTKNPLLFSSVLMNKK